jgi:hypothetical protein
MMHISASIVRVGLLILTTGLGVGPGAATTALAALRLPEAYVDTTYPQQNGNTVVVNAGGNLQAALNDAQPGDTIVLQAGATFRGPFTLPAKSGTGRIVITSSASLPAEGTRVTPAEAGLMPKLESLGDEVIVTAAGARGYRFVGIELRPTPGVFVFNLVLLGTNSETTLDELPRDIVFDRCYLHGDPQAGTRRGIVLNGAHLAVIDSYLADFKEVGADTQAVAGWAGPGPYKIVNNYLEGAGENLMFGGADPRIQGVVPSDIEIRGNHFRKPLSWRIEDPSYAGVPWTVKNLLELKNARRVLIEGNLLEYSWGMAQNGYAVVFTVRSDGGAPWSTVEDVLFANNVVRHAAGGMSIHGYDNHNPAQLSQRIAIRNNLFEDMDGKRWNGDGRLFQLLRGPKDVVIEHNTGFADNSTIVMAGEPLANFVFRDNIVNYGLYGIYGDGKGLGLAAINFYLPGSEVRRNVFIGNTGAQALYPADNTFVATMANVGFVNAAGGDYELQATGPFKRGATDGTDVGVNFDLMDAGDVSTPPSALASPLSSPTAPTLTVSPTTITPGGTVTATWSGIVAPTSTDWIGLYAVGTANTAEITWIYVSCTKSAGAARASDSCAFTVPSGLMPGSYELRLFPQDGYTRQATSGTLTVIAPAGAVTLNASPTSVARGGTVTATWSGIATPTWNDWIGLYAVGTANTAEII